MRHLSKLTLRLEEGALRLLTSSIRLDNAIRIRGIKVGSAPLDVELIKRPETVDVSIIRRMGDVEVEVIH
jgi:hypothetical protein